MIRKHQIDQKLKVDLYNPNVIIIIRDVVIEATDVVKLSKSGKYPIAKFLLKTKEIAN